MQQKEKRKKETHKRKKNVVTMFKYKFIDLSNYKILLKDNQYKSYYFKCLFIGP